MKRYSKGDFFTNESLKTNEKISITRQEFNLNLLTLREMNCKDHTKFFRLILLLSGDINLNPGPTQISKTWSVFKKRGLHFVHLNINSLPSKIEELRQIAKDTNSAVIGLSETKLDKTIFDSEISIPNYSLIRKDRNRKGGGVACYIRSDICFNSQNYLSDEVCTNLFYFRFRKTYKTSYENNMSHLKFLLITLSPTEEKVTQSGVINTLPSDHQLIFCTNKIKRVKTNNHKQISFVHLKTIQWKTLSKS